MAGTVRNLSYAVSFNGTTLTNVVSFRWSLGYDLSSGEAEIVLPLKSDAGTYFDDVSIIVDGSTRWSGLLYEWNYRLYPRAVSMICKGRLARADDYKLPTVSDTRDKGLLLDDLTGGPATDEAIVSAVLDYAGVGTNGGSIGGTGQTLGTIAPEEFVWNYSDSALSYIHKIDAISLGYRTFESVGGQIYRVQISGRPDSGPELTFTEGVDIREGQTSRTVSEAYNAVRISGYAVGDYLDPRVWYQAESNPFMSESQPRVYTQDNPMIERRANESAGEGISCQALAEYWLRELNREIVKVTMRTPRSDVIGPGQVHLVQGPGGSADRMGVGEVLWVQRCDGELTQDGAFSQSITYVGGGT